MGVAIGTATRARSGTPRAAPTRSYCLEWIDESHPARSSIECFIVDNFFLNYGAHVRQFCQRLAGCRAPDGRWLAAVGYTPLARRRAFLEHYLDAPIEHAIALHAGVPIRRAELVEAGNLAALDAGASRALISGMTQHLHAQGFAWVALTGTRALLNSFARLGIRTHPIAAADPLRLPDEGRSWGSYYASNPHVVYGHIPSGHARLLRQAP